MFLDLFNLNNYFYYKEENYTEEDYKEYVEWKGTLSDYELKKGFYSINNCVSYEPTFSWYMKHRDYLKQYYERINDWRKLKPNQFLVLEKPKISIVNYNEWNW